MGFLIGLLYAIDIIVALLLIGIIMIQQSKSGGGLGAIAGGMGESVFGASAGNVITKTTVVLCALFLGVTLALAILSGRVSEAESLAERLQRGEAPAATDVPADMEAEAEAVQDEADATPQDSDDAAAADDETEAPEATEDVPALIEVPEDEAEE